LHWTTPFGAEAALIAGVCWIVLWSHQRLAHGTTQVNEMQMALGFTWMDSGKLFVLPFMLLTVTIVGLHPSRRNLGRPGKSSLFVMAALVWLVVATAIEFWGFPPGSYDLTFEEEVRPVLEDGWWLQALGSLFLTLAFVPFGIHLVREKVLPTWMVPVVILGSAATVFLTPSFFVPGVAWLLLGLTLLRHRRRTIQP
jgi:hypothetical protein